MVLAQQGVCEISALNEKGVGVAETNQGEVYLPLTLPGEVVEFEQHLYRGSTSFLLKKIITPSKNRTIPPCKYFGLCGGCALQHVEESAYDKIKVEFIEKALASFSI
jgi:23S rRNA (uracil1939-C5)-methyltransferase